MKKTLTLLSAVLLLTAGFAPAARAEGKKSPIEGQPSIRHKTEMRKNRLEIAPQFVVSINQDFRHFIGGGLVLQYHITDWLGIGVQIAGGGGLDSGLTGNIMQQLASEGDATKKPAQFQPSQEQFRAHLATTQLLMSAYATVTPFAGKLAMFGALFLRYDLYAILGVGFMRFTNTWDSYGGTKLAPSDCDNTSVDTDPNKCDPKNSGFKVAGTFGVGLHLYFNQWLGLNVELRDFLNSSNPGGLDVNGDRKLTADDQTIQNSLFVGVGLSFMLPVTARISP